MKNMLDKVINLLTKHPSLRDSDERLAANIWYNNIKNVDEIDAITLLSRFAEGKLPSYESISRCRRKIQEEKPDLRGKKWAKRHSKQQLVKDEIKEIGAMLNG
tara:strand:+ start:133 stop:441 length:309 start_codon:yes stop_codon:yes gene_type:complete